MNYSVADVSVALDSISQICDSGATVVFNKHGGYIERPDGRKTTFKRDRDTYIREVWIPTAPGSEGTGRPFERPTQS